MCEHSMIICILLMPGGVVRHLHTLDMLGYGYGGADAWIIISDYLIPIPHSYLKACLILITM